MFNISAACFTSRTPLLVLAPRRYSPLRRMVSSVSPCAIPFFAGAVILLSALTLFNPPTAVTAPIATAPFKKVLRFDFMDELLFMIRNFLLELENGTIVRLVPACPQHRETIMRTTFFRRRSVMRTACSTGPDTTLLPVAQYLRMSTDQQQYSLLNQAAAIAKYAELRGFTVIQTYEDAGRTGLVLRERPGLQALLRM